MPEKPYTCHVSIDVEASSPQEAAEYAEECLRDPECRGWVVRVETPGEPPMLIDNAGELEPRVDSMLPPGFDERELATVLAALRNLQACLQPPFLCGDWTEAEKTAVLKGRFEHFADCEPLSMTEIDALCERLNVKPQEEDQGDDDDTLDLSAEWHENDLGTMLRDEANS